MEYAPYTSTAVNLGKSKWRSHIRGPNKLIYVVLVILCLGVALTLLNIIELHKMKEERSMMAGPEARTYESPIKQPVLWMYGVSHDAIMTGFLRHVYAVFQRVGFVLGDEKSDWEVLWSHDYPFAVLSMQLSQLKPHQKVNHFPGSGYITNKASLAVTNLTFIPKAFMIPKERKSLLNFAARHPEKLWVQKSNSHRGVEIKKVKDLDLTKEGSFIQEYVAKPFLIDSRKFDIGVYAVLTSINPLRVYIVKDDALFRFCPADYHPFDATNLDKYVVREDYTPVWEMPSLKHIYTDMNFNFKETFNYYLHLKAVNYRKIWDEIEETIVTVYQQKEPLLLQATAKYKSTRNFFEMVRFDFVLDEDYNVYLMEANMSPNLSSAHFIQNRLLYEHVLFNLLSLVGIARSVAHDFQRSPDDEAEMMASDKDIQVLPDKCSSDECHDKCSALVCKLCHKCLTQENRLNIKLAYLEHMRRGSCRRLFPPPMSLEVARDVSAIQHTAFYQKLTDKNKLMVLWFAGKCQLDPTFCA